MVGGGPLCGAQLRYLIRCQRGWLGALAFSAGAYRLSARDAWLGWDATERQANLERIVCNSRFLILPEVRVPHLASHVLAQIDKRLGTDWHPFTHGLGPIGSHKEGPIGLWLHATLAFTPGGVPLGLLDVQCWARDAEAFGQKHWRKQRPIEDKESFKWIKSWLQYLSQTAYNRFVDDRAINNQYKNGLIKFKSYHGDLCERLDRVSMAGTALWRLASSGVSHRQRRCQVACQRATRRVRP
jgi:hypothetical protein